MNSNEINIIDIEITTKGVDIILVEYYGRTQSKRFLATWCREGTTEKKLKDELLPGKKEIENARNPQYWAKQLRKQSLTYESIGKGYPALTETAAKEKFRKMIEAVPFINFT